MSLSEQYPRPARLVTKLMMRSKSVLRRVPLLKKAWRRLHRLTDALPKPVPQIEAYLPWLEPPNLRFCQLPDSEWHVNVLLPSLALKHMSGGPNTALHLTYRLARAGIPIRYISVDHPLEADGAKLWAHVHSLTGIRERLPHVQFVNAWDKSAPAAVGENDVFFGTAWWTVQKIKSILPQSKVKQFLYLVQDYEPGLYPWSTAYALAQGTYDLPFYAVVNEPTLLQHLVKERVGRFAEKDFLSNQCVVFNPAVDRRFFFPEARAGDRKPKVLVFYTRPGTAPRNLFELGLAALQAVGRAGVLAPAEWQVTCIGDPVPALEVASGVKLNYVPWAGYEAYARFLRQSDVGLSLMLSPHTSYPPLEMAACGMTAVTTAFSTKTAGELAEISSNLVAAPPTVDGLRDAVVAAIGRSNNWPARLAGSALNLPATWDDAVGPLIPRIIQMIEACRTTRRTSAKLECSKRATA